MSFSEIRKFLKQMQSEDNLRKEVTSSATADDIALIAQRLGYSFSGDDLLRFNGQKVDKVTVRKVNPTMNLQSNGLMKIRIRKSFQLMSHLKILKYQRL